MVKCFFIGLFFYTFVLNKIMNNRYYFSFLTLFVTTFVFGGPGGGPPPPTPPPPPGFPLDGGLIYLLIFGLFFAFFKLRNFKFQK